MKNKCNISNKKIITYLCILIAVIFIVNTITKISTGRSITATLFGYRPVIVISGSMEPEILTNSISLLQYYNIRDIQIGHIIMYRHNNASIVHRVINKNVNDIGEIYLTTKGDANRNQDNVEVTADKLEGRIVRTFNNTVKYVNFFMLSPGETNPTAITQAILFLIVFLYLASIVIYNFIAFTSILIISYKSNKTFDKHIKEYENTLQKQFELMSKLEKISESGNKGIISALCRAKAIREIKHLKDSVKDFEKGLKIIDILLKARFYYKRLRK